MIERNIAPSINEIHYGGFPDYEVKSLRSGAKVYFLENELDDATKVEMLLPAGSSHQEKKLLSSFYAELMLKGTKDWNAHKISEQLDHLGGFYGAESDKDHLSFQLYGLSEQMPGLIDIVIKAIEKAEFPQKEFDKLQKIRRQKMSINEQKVKYRSRRAFIHYLFGATPYGQTADWQDIDRLTREDILHHHQFVRLLQPTFFVVGKWSESFRDAIERFAAIFGDQENHNIKVYEQAHKGPVHDEKGDAVQSAIRIGRTFPLEDHKDFYALKVMSTLFGGYFGSRLMMNLREDKGLTYGIGSIIVPLQYAHYLAIVTEVNANQTQLALNEIHKEIDLLMKEPPSESELEMVRNYMKGQFLRSLDGNFMLIERLKTKWKLGYDDNYEEKLLAAIQNTSADEISNLAKKYLSKDDLLSVTSGRLK